MRRTLKSGLERRLTVYALKTLNRALNNSLVETLQAVPRH